MTVEKDIQFLYDTLKARLGQAEVLAWVERDFPWLPDTLPLRAWWILQNKYDEVVGVCPLCRAMRLPEAILCPRCQKEIGEARYLAWNPISY